MHIHGIADVGGSYHGNRCYIDNNKLTADVGSWMNGSAWKYVEIGGSYGRIWEWTEASADADGSFVEVRSQLEVLEANLKIWKPKAALVEVE